VQPSPSELPKDPTVLTALLIASRVELAASHAELTEVRTALEDREREIEALKWQLAKLRRMQFGRSSEKLSIEIEQLELLIEELETTDVEAVAEPVRSSTPAPQKPVRRALPAELPRESIVHVPDCTCVSCGGRLRRIGESVS
jgi:transposase